MNISSEVVYRVTGILVGTGIILYFVYMIVKLAMVNTMPKQIQKIFNKVKDDMIVETYIDKDGNQQIKNVKVRDNGAKILRKK